MKGNLRVSAYLKISPQVSHIGRHLYDILRRTKASPRPYATRVLCQSVSRRTAVASSNATVPTVELRFLLAGLTVSAGVAAAAVTPYSESGTTCPGLLHAAQAVEDSGCNAYYYDRFVLVVVLFAAAAVLFGAGLLAMRRPRIDRALVARGCVREDRWLVIILASVAAAPFMYLVISVPTWLFVVPFFPSQSNFGVPDAWQPLSHALGALVAGLIVVAATRLRPGGALAAAAVGLPGMTAVQGFWQYILPRAMDSRPFLTDSPLGWLLSAAPLALAMAVAVRLQKRGFSPPAPVLSCALILLSNALATFTLLRELQPNFKVYAGSDLGYFSPSMWLTLLALPWLVSVMALALAYRRSPTPPQGDDHRAER